MKPSKPANQENQPVQPFRNELTDAIQRFFEEPLFSSPGSFFNKASNFRPAINVAEKEDRYCLEVEIPGVDPEQVDIELEGNVLTIKGEKTKEQKVEDKEQRMYKVEHSYGSFYRSLTLPENIDNEHISAETKNGMLYIDVPKSEQSKAKKINIKKPE